MRRPLFRQITFLLVGTILASCAPKTAPIGSETQRVAQIRDIRVAPTPDKTEVFVVGEGPMLYTTFYLTEPNRLIVDILETGVGAFTSEIPVPEGPIQVIRPQEREDGRVARLEMGLAENVLANVKQEGTTLSIEAVLPADAAKPVAVVEEKVAPVAAPVKRTRPPATVISDIRFDRKEALHLVVVGDGELFPEPFYVDAQRLVIDFEGVRLTTEIEALLANHHAVKQVRVGKHPGKVRLVLDLLAPVEYSIKQTEEELRVRLKEGTAEKMREQIHADTARREALPPPPPSPPPPPPPASAQVPAAPAPTVAPTVVARPEPKKEDRGLAPEAKPALPPPSPPRPMEVAVGESFPVPQPLLTPKYVGRKISLDFQDADISDIIRLIAEVSRLNIVLSDDVKGKMTLKLDNVPWDQALDVILQMNSLGQDRDGNIIIISTLSSITQRQEQEVRAKETGMAAEDRITEVVALNYSTAESAMEPIKKMLSPRGDITVDRRTNTLIIKDIEETMKDAIRMARLLDTRTPQVSIEARIVQALPKFNRSLGVQWGARYKSIAENNLIQASNPLTGTGFGVSNPGFAVNAPAALNLGGFGLTFGRFTDTPLALDLRLSAGESQGLTRIISTPKVTVLDNQEAKIEQGESIPYSTTSAQGTQTTFVDANITLNVTPHISADGGIVMKIRVTKNSPGGLHPGASGPSIIKKEATTNVLVLDGETIVIGGIHEITEVETISGIPFLSKIPIIGWVFKNKERRKEDSELLVFLTPKLVQYAR